MATEFAVAVIVFLFVGFAVSHAIYAVFHLWKRRYPYILSIKIRRPIHIIISYVITLPFLIERSISLFYLYFKEGGITVVKYEDNIPITYSPKTDITLHFLFWSSFWSFVQSKLLKIMLIRNDHEFQKTINSIEWNDNKASIPSIPKPKPNESWMIILQIIMITIILCIQISVRISTQSQLIEQIIALIIASCDMIIMYIFYKMIHITDNFYLKQEIKYQISLSIFTILCWIIGLIIYETTDISYIWLHCGIGLYAIWLSLFCYLEINFVIKKLQTDGTIHYHQSHHAIDPMVEMRSFRMHPRRLSNYSNTLDPDSFYDPMHTMPHHQHLRLRDILSSNIGFQVLMEFMMNEFSSQYLLAFIEFVQFIMSCHRSLEDESKRKRRYDYLVVGYLRSICNEYSMYIPMEIEAMILEYYMRLYFIEPSDELMQKLEVFCSQFSNIGTYFDIPQFNDDIVHFEYLINKYINNDAVFRLDVSYRVRMHSKHLMLTLGMESEAMLDWTNSIGRELLSYVTSSYHRFKRTHQYLQLYRHQYS